MLVRSWGIFMLFIAPFVCFSQEPSTWGEIFNYEVGDVFHFTENAESPNWNEYYEGVEVVRITDKWYSENMDTLFYATQVEKLYRHTYQPEWTYEVSIDSLKYHYLDLPYYSDTVYYNGLYNGRLVNYVFHFSPWWIEELEYAEGCGQVTRYYEDPGPYRIYYNTKTMVYFKKGFEEWGDPVSMEASIDDMRSEFEISIQPNPSTTMITINSTNNAQIDQVQIYNSNGELIITAEDGYKNINMSHLSPGLYIVKVIGDNWIINRKLIVQ